MRVDEAELDQFVDHRRCHSGTVERQRPVHRPVDLDLEAGLALGAFDGANASMRLMRTLSLSSSYT